MSTVTFNRSDLQPAYKRLLMVLAHLPVEDARVTVAYAEFRLSDEAVRVTARETDPDLRLMKAYMAWRLWHESMPRPLVVADEPV